MQPDATFDRMKGAVGSLLLLWSQIERTARDEVARRNGGVVPKTAHTLSGALNAWTAAMAADAGTRPFQASLAAALRAQLQRPLDIRNGVCHGLVGISAGHHGNPATLSWELNGKKHTFSWDELQVLFGWLSRIPDAIAMISDAAEEPDHDRAQRLLPGPEWWAAEYATILPVGDSPAR